MAQRVKTSTPKHQKTYKVDRSAELTRSTSPDNTDQEISSLTDLPNEDKSPRDYISPGEEKVTSTFTESYAAATTTDYGSLSLGEVPVAGVKKLSDLEMRDKHPDSIEISKTSNKMEEALRAISEELLRCRVLLQGQLPAQVIPDLISSYRAVRN
ncbi:uncharacterized protein LOC128199938 [Bicyclus anynana]|uniref:Uncharacterized protein LOC128199938 n=1 Tax=Bicyclus anynana TaxID=110368 RepID=A0ABM3M8Y5_BICAN|nr:uncharacterized protein LOC128199938 [Bicyclus anynana]